MTTQLTASPTLFLPARRCCHSLWLNACHRGMLSTSQAIPPSQQLSTTSLPLSKRKRPVGKARSLVQTVLLSTANSSKFWILFTRCYHQTSIASIAIQGGSTSCFITLPTVTTTPMSKSHHWNKAPSTHGCWSALCGGPRTCKSNATVLIKTCWGRWTWTIVLCWGYISWGVDWVRSRPDTSVVVQWKQYICHIPRGRNFKRGW